MSAGRRRPAWDEVRTRKARDAARVAAERDAALAAGPARPVDVWRVSGAPVLVLRPDLAAGVSR